MIRSWSNPPDNGNVVELTREELFESTVLYDKQKVSLGRVLTFAELLNMKVWFYPEVPCISFESGEDLSDVIGLDGSDALNNVAFTLEFICRMQGLGLESTDEKTAQTNLFDLTRRVETLENTLRKLTPCTQDAQDQTVAEHYPSEDLDTGEAQDDDPEAEWNKLPLELTYRKFLANLCKRAEGFGGKVICDANPEKRYCVRGKAKDERFNCSYLRPKMAFAQKSDRLVPLPISRAYRPTWAHKSLDTKSPYQTWFFNLPQDFSMLEHFISHDEQFIQKKS